MPLKHCRVEHQLKSCLFILLILWYAPAKAGDSLQISLLTCSPGAELYSVFGHSAFRVVDPDSGLDKVYNYGTFNFREKNFYLKFLSGKLNYYLSTQTFTDFMSDYLAENRSVFEQVFKLTPVQSQLLYQELQLNMAPQNRAYKYDFFWDNCSTRIRDKIEAVFPTTIQYPDLPTVTFRDYLHKYLVPQPWSQLGIDLILGLPADKKTVSREAMFLPMEMMYVYDQTQTGNQAVCLPSVNILPSSPMPLNTGIFHPQWVFILLLAITLIQFKFFPGSAVFKVYANLFFIFTGLAGLLIGFLWFIADHTTTDNNLHFIWANPLCLLYPYRNKLFSKKWVTGMTLLYSLLLLFMIFGILFLPQDLPLTCIPIWLSLLVLAIADLRRNREIR